MQVLTFSYYKVMTDVRTCSFFFFLYILFVVLMFSYDMTLTQLLKWAKLVGPTDQEGKVCI
jgi:hypothetical protein